MNILIFKCLNLDSQKRAFSAHIIVLTSIEDIFKARVTLSENVYITNNKLYNTQRNQMKYEQYMYHMVTV